MTVKGCLVKERGIVTWVVAEEALGPFKELSYFWWFHLRTFCGFIHPECIQFSFTSSLDILGAILKLENKHLSKANLTEISSKVITLPMWVTLGRSFVLVLISRRTICYCFLPEISSIWL